MPVTKYVSAMRDVRCVMLVNGLVSVHPEISKCHSEPFDGLRTDSAKNLQRNSNQEIVRRGVHPEPAEGLLRMTGKSTVSG